MSDSRTDNKKAESEKETVLKKLQAEKDAVNAHYSQFDRRALVRADQRDIPLKGDDDNDNALVGSAGPSIPKLNPGYYSEKEPDKKGKKFTFLIDDNNNVSLTGKPPHSGEDWGKLLDVYKQGLGASHLRIKFGKDASPDGISLGEVRTILEQAIKKGVAITLDDPVLLARFNNPKKGEDKLIQQLHEMAATSQRLAAGSQLIEADNKYVKMTPDEKAKHLEMGRQREAVEHNFYLKNLEGATGGLATAIKAMKDMPAAATDAEKTEKAKAVTDAQAKVDAAIANVKDQASIKPPTGDMAKAYEDTFGAALKGQKDAKAVINEPEVRAKIADKDFQKMGSQIDGAVAKINEVAQSAKLGSLDPDARLQQKSDKINKAVDVLKQMGDAVQASPNDAKTQDAYAQQFNHLANMLKETSGEIKKDQSKEQVQAYKDVIMQAGKAATDNLKGVQAVAPAISDMAKSGSDQIAYASAQVRVSNNEYLKEDIAAIAEMKVGNAKLEAIEGVQERLLQAANVIGYEGERATTPQKVDALSAERSQVQAMSADVEKYVANMKESTLMPQQQKDALQETQVKVEKVLDAAKGAIQSSAETIKAEQEKLLAQDHGNRPGGPGTSAA